MKFSKIVAVLCLVGAFALGFSGCSAKVKNAEFLKEQDSISKARAAIIIGKTTQDEILKKYGEPSRKDTNKKRLLANKDMQKLADFNGNSTAYEVSWIYEYEETEKSDDLRRFIPGAGKTLFGGEKKNNKTLTITFDKEKLVRIFSTSENNVNDKGFLKREKEEMDEGGRLVAISGSDKLSQISSEQEAKNITKNKGKMTKKQIIAKYGEPNRIGKVKEDFQIKADEVWIYMYFKYYQDWNQRAKIPVYGESFKDTMSVQKGLTIFFDKDDKVICAERTLSNEEYKRVKKEKKKSENCGFEIK